MTPLEWIMLASAALTLGERIYQHFATGKRRTVSWYLVEGARRLPADADWASVAGVALELAQGDDAGITGEQIAREARKMVRARKVNGYSRAAAADTEKRP